MADIYNIYASPWGGTPEEIDFTTTAFTSTDNPIILDSFMDTVGGSGDGTIYLCVRHSLDGIEEQNFNIITFTIYLGQWTGRYIPVHNSVPFVLLDATPNPITDASGVITWHDS